MPKDQHKNSINKTQGNMILLEHSYLTTVSPGYSNTMKADENDLKNSLIKMIRGF